MLFSMLDGYPNRSFHYQGVTMPEEQGWNEVLFARCDEAQLSARAQHALYNAGVEIWAQLVTLTDEQVLGIKNVGKHTLNELKEILAEFHLNLGMFQHAEPRRRLNEELRKRGLPLITQWDEQKGHYPIQPFSPPSSAFSPTPAPEESPRMEPAPATPKLSELLITARGLLEARRSQIQAEMKQFEQLLGSVTLGLVINVQEGQTPPAICAFLREHPQPTIQQILDQLKELEIKWRAIETAFAHRGTNCLDFVIKALQVHERYERPL
jgi:hypothetical protein